LLACTYLTHPGHSKGQNGLSTSFWQLTFLSLLLQAHRKKFFALSSTQAEARATANNPVAFEAPAAANNPVTFPPFIQA
jgi:hypothetical protein